MVVIFKRKNHTYSFVIDQLIVAFDALTISENELEKINLIIKNDFTKKINLFKLLTEEEYCNLHSLKGRLIDEILKILEKRFEDKNIINNFSIFLIK